MAEPFQRKSIRRPATLFVSIAVLQVVSALIIFLMSERTVELHNRVDTSRRAVLNIERTLSTLTDAETGQRGYLLTAREDYLDPYTLALGRLRRDRAAMKAYAQANPREGAEVDEIMRLIDVKLEEMKSTIDLRRVAGLGPALEKVQSDQGKDTMDQIRGHIKTLEQNEEKVVGSDEDQAQQADASRTAVLGALLVLNLGFILWVGMRVLREVRMREAAAVLIAHQKELLAVTLASIGDAVISTDRSGKVTFMNQIAQDLTGWTEAEARGRSLPVVFNIINEATRIPVESPVDKVLREGAIVGLANHTLLIRKDGTELPIDDSGAPIRSAGGQIEGVVLVFRDFTAQKQSEEAITRSEEQLRLAVDAADLGTFSAVAPIVELTWNDKCKEQHFLPPDATVTLEGFYDRLQPDDRARIKGAMDQALRDHTPFDMEYRVAGPGGGIRWIRALGRFYYDHFNTPTRLDGVTLDVSAQKESQDLLQQAKTQAEQANQAKDQFVAALSHELRTPLTPVLATLTNWEAEGTMPAELRNDLLMMRRNVELEARLIDDLLDLTRVVKGKLSLNLEDVDVHEVLQQVVRICRSETNAKCVRVVVKAQAQRHWVRGDSARLQQVLWNILRNAAKFSDPNSEVTITTSNAANGDLRVEVIDHGIGMEAGTLARLFKPFAQGSDAITRKFGGLGMGLAISKALVDMQGGSLTVVSKGLNQGATFTVTLPTADPPRERPTNGKQPQRVLVRRGLHILLVEDHADTARTMAHLLRRLEHEVQVTGTVREALAAGRAGTFDLVISDIGLPDGSGIDFIREFRRFSSTPAIALTGFGMDEDIARTAEAGFNAHLTKPVNFVKLETLMYQVAAK